MLATISSTLLVIAATSTGTPEPQPIERMTVVANPSQMQLTAAGLFRVAMSEAHYDLIVDVLERTQADIAKVGKETALYTESPLIAKTQ